MEYSLDVLRKGEGGDNKENINLGTSINCLEKKTHQGKFLAYANAKDFYRERGISEKVEV